MVLVVNNELKMGKGKMIAQGAHASLGLYRAMLEKPEFNDMLVRWDMAGSMKVALKGKCKPILSGSSLYQFGLLNRR